MSSRSLTRLGTSVTVTVLPRSNRYRSRGVAMVQQTVIWGTFCLLAVAASLWRPRATRIGLGVFFIIMAIGVNAAYAVVAPDGFVSLGTDAPLLPPYRWAFATVVSTAPAAFGLAMAAFEATIGVLLIRGG